MQHRLFCLFVFVVVVVVAFFLVAAGLGVGDAGCIMQKMTP